MTGLSDTDIKLDTHWQLTQAANGDAPLVGGYDCLYQNILLEALTYEGDLFYDETFGWSLYDFVQSEDDELTRLEITSRIRSKLQARDVILADTITVSVQYDKDTFVVFCSFCFDGEGIQRTLNVRIDSISVEVIHND